ncbi:eukaryotic translation initiation factor 4 gamma 2 [Onthophagus taurus]|uniref:eukaryotic translation initiation factor 4 gamma 2 n=1 Tax=Onthophagus taurus TaxID=166361 RepID=UPI000C202EF7|nr:eukaryotic translation initiation factor 4 gamma 2-like [Onthophagus taurus]
MYAQLCKRLSEEAPNFEPANRPCTFRVLLLNKCKAEFENRAATLDQYGHGDNTLEEEERRQLAKRKMLGNIKFIGELGKLEILAEGILHRCIQELLITRKGDDPSEDLECLCQILRTCGRILDTNKGKGLMDQYFERMALLAENQELAPRIRFMLKDVIDLRQNEWVPRKATIVEGPMPIHQIRPTEDDRVGFRRDRNQDYRSDIDRSGGHDIFWNPMKLRSGIDEMLMNISTSGTNLIPSFGSNGFGGQRDSGGYRSHNNQRSGYNNYNNQRGQYKHNQNNTNSQYNNQSSKDIAPRFKKNFIMTHNFGELELRPASYSLSNKPIKNSNNVINNTRPIDPLPQSTPKQAPAPLLKEVPIKQVSTEKPKQAKKDKGPSKDEVIKKYMSLIENYLKGDTSLEDTISNYKENKVPDKFLKEAITNSFKLSLDKTDDDRTKLIKLYAALRQDNNIGNTVIHDAFKTLCNGLDECENELTQIMSSVAVIFSAAVAERVASLSDIANLTDNGVHYPLFVLVLQELYKTKGQTELYELFTNSKVQLLSQLPENDRTKERLAEVLEERDLTFLYPLVRIQAELSKQLQVDPNPQVFYKWIKENVDSVNYTNPGFINALMTVLLKYISQEAIATPLEDDKTAADVERGLLEKYQPILHSFLHEHLNLQLIAIYSLQVHFFSLGFPRGQILRWFMALYDLEIVEEEAFLNWKEDVTDAYPGKGNALFQVNSWLTWLQEAESEEEEEGDE